jgi:hypothetical protein
MIEVSGVIAAAKWARRRRRRRTGGREGKIMITVLMGWKGRGGDDST